MMNRQKADNICGMIKLDETTLKLVDGVLTAVTTTEVGEVIKAPCGGFKLDGNVPDRLRWCRHHMGLMQKEVAELIGITRGHYIDFEVGYVDHYPKEIVDKLA